MSLAARVRREEQMDDPALPPDVYDRVLADLGRVNVWTFAARPTLAFLTRAVPKGGRFRLLDIGFGDGGMLRAIARWAARKGREAELVGVDLNPKSAPSAASATPPHLRIDYRTGDYRNQEGPFDVVISSLVAHHMTDGQLIDYLKWSEGEARRGWFVNDLHRHPLAFHSFPILTALLRSHRIVREDGRLSIARSFRPAEWRAILAEAGIGEARVRRYFPFRLCVERLR